MKDLRSSFLVMIKSSIIYTITFPLDFACSMSARILSPILSYYSIVKDIDVLPYPFNLFHTHDDTLDGGQHQLGWPNITTKSELWWQRTKWIFRNAGYGFSAYVFGRDKNSNTPIIKSYDIGNWDSGKSNYSLWKSPNAFSFRMQYYYFGNSKYFLRVWLGWKLHSPATNGKVIMVTHINPFRGIKL